MEGKPHLQFLRVTVLLQLPILLTTSGAASPQVGRELEFREVARAGDFGGEVEFGRIADIAVDSSGFAWVADRMHNVIVVLDRDLQHSTMLGGKGSGPGEFRSVARLTLVRDTVSAFDPALARLSLFDSRGSLLRTYTGLPLSGLKPDSSITPRAPDAVLAGGLLLQTAIHGRRGEPNRALVLYSYDPVGGIARPLARLQTDMSVARISFSEESGYAYVPRPFDFGDLYQVSPVDGTVVVLNQKRPADQDPFQVHLWRTTATGDTLMEALISVRPRRLDRQIALEAIEPAAEDFADMIASRSRYGRKEAFDAYMEAMDVPVYQVPFDRLVVSRTGEIYLREGSFGLRRARWIGLDRNGTVQGSFSLPRDVDLMAAHGHRLFGSTTGDFEEPVLTVWEQVHNPD